MMSVILSCHMHLSLVAISFSKSSTNIKSILKGQASYKKNGFNSCNINQIKLDISRYIIGYGFHFSEASCHSAIHSIHSSYEEYNVLVNHSRVGIILACAPDLYLLLIMHLFYTSLSVKRINCCFVGFMIRGLIAR